MDFKELNTKSYEKNSKYHRHTGPGVSAIQKSRSYKEDKSRKWRKRQKKDSNKEDRKHTKIDMNNPNFKCQDKFERRNTFHHL